MNPNALSFYTSTTETRYQHGRFHSKERRGHSLIELLTVFAVLLIFGIATARLLVTVTQVGLSSNQRKARIAAIDRLSDDFRGDARRADSAKLSGESEVTFLVAGDVISYRIDQDQNAVLRNEVQAKSKVRRLETYSLTDRCQPAFAQYSSMIALRLTPENAPSPWIIEVVAP